LIKHLRINLIQRKFVYKHETNILLFRNLLNSFPLIKHPIVFKYLLNEIAFFNKTFVSRARTSGICILTGRMRSVYKKNFKLTRMQVKEKANYGLIPGVKKSSW
jgi:ribosomal protein S14